VRFQISFHKWESEQNQGFVANRHSPLHVPPSPHNSSWQTTDPPMAWMLSSRPSAMPAMTRTWRMTAGTSLRAQPASPLAQTSTLDWRTESSFASMFYLLAHTYHWPDVGRIILCRLFLFLSLYFMFANFLCADWPTSWSQDPARSKRHLHLLFKW
jgi:hypothetical protein